MKFTVRFQVYQERMRTRILVVEADDERGAVEAARRATPSGWRGGAVATPVAEKADAKEGA